MRKISSHCVVSNRFSKFINMFIRSAHALTTDYQAKFYGPKRTKLSIVTRWLHVLSRGYRRALCHFELVLMEKSLISIFVQAVVDCVIIFLSHHRLTSFS